jgi:protein kinase-like protein
MPQSPGMMGDDTIGAEVWPNFALPAGTTVNGYRIERVLGSGGFGITYLATDLLSQRFAIKEYFPRQLAVRQNQQVVAASAEDAAMFNDGKERFLREAKALVLLSRSSENRGGIVRVQTYFESHGTALFVMDYLEGGNLASVLRKYPDGLPAERLDSILRQLLASVRIVHRAGLMHRDIKPANIILRDDDTVVLIDFGAIRETTTEHATVYTQIYSGGYAPPEQMTGMPQGEFSDIYAIGAVAYRAIGGKPVNAMARQNAMAGGHADIQATAERIGAGRYPKKLLAAIDAAQALDPRRRPQTVDAMLAALGPSAAEQPTVIARRVADSAAGSRRRLILWGAAAVACVAIAIGGGAYLLRSPASIPVANQERPPIVQQQAVASVPAEAPVQQPPPPVPAAPAPQPQAVPQVTNQQAPAAAPVQAPLPQDQPRQEALAPPQEQQEPQRPPQPEISPLERAQAAAAAVPCAALAVAQGPLGLRVSGFAGPGPEFDRLLADLRETGNVTKAVTAVDSGVCTTITAFAPAIRQGLATTPITPTIRLNSQRVAEGNVLRVDIEAPAPVLLLDLYQNDGTVRHLRTSNRRAEWIAKGPPGPRVLVAIASAEPLFAGTRPEIENSRDYLAVLRPRLDSTGSSVMANLAIVTVYPAPPAVMRAPQRPAASSARCANIVSRAQLGETLTDEELAALRTECRS